MLKYIYSIYRASVQAQHSRFCAISSSFCYDSLVTWTVICLTTAKFKPLILSMPGFTLPNITILLNSTRSVDWYSLGADPTENTLSVLIWVAWYHVFHCSGTDRLVPDRVETPLPAALLLLRDVTADVTYSSVACAIIVPLINLLCRNLVTATYML
jgi:hypothetical protein